MTVPTLNSVAEFSTNGVTTNFPFFFKFLANEDLIVTYVSPVGVSTPLTYGSQYTVNGAGDEGGGSIVTTTALAGPGQLIVSREMDAYQQTSLRNQGKFLAETHEDVFDRLTMLIQQGFSIFKRALVRPLGRDYYDAENRRIANVANPTQDQDAATKWWVTKYIGDLLAAIQGPINNALNIFYQYPDGTAHVVQDLSGPTGASGIGAPGGTVVDYLPARVHVRKFGVKSDGITDDSTALENALLAGVPLDFGSGIIRITRALGNQALIPGAINWKSNGAKIQLDSAVITESMLYFSVLPLSHRIEGVLILDGASKAFCGLYLRNNSTDFFPIGYGTFYSADTQVQNIRRADSTYANGDGILIRGGFTTVVFDRPVVKNVVLASGAGIPGIVGVSGITIFGNSDGIGYPRSVTINDPVIDNISSEDAAYNSDQDGIRCFGPHAVTAGTAAINSTFRVNGGVFTNCWGRSIKSQMTTGEIVGSKFIRTTGPTVGGNEEIGFQQGAGFVQDITCLYYGGNVPYCVINGGQGTVDRRRPALKVNGVFIVNHSSPAIQHIVQTFSPANDAGLVSISKVEVQGPIDRLVEYLVDGDANALSISDICVNNLSSELVRVKTSGLSSPFAAKVFATTCYNSGSIKPLLTHRVAGNSVTAELSEYACTGFTRVGSADTFLPNPGSLMRPFAIAGEGQAIGGSMRVQGTSIVAGATGTLAGHGVNNGTCLALFSVNRGNLSQALIAISPTGVTLLTAGSTDIVVGTTAEPASGTIRLWAGAGGLLNIRNGDASSRTFTLVSIG
ncbi:hypothetical protein Q7F05_19690 [Pseudomonas sp. Lb2C1-1]|uniref:hypothetical protein n=1 Tax=Pseudomonas TaxID=286 RepID=UPI00391AFDE6